MATRPTFSLRRAMIPRIAALARRLPPRPAMALRPLTAAALRAVPGWRARVEQAMRHALGEGGVPPGAVRAYFDRFSDLLSMSAVAYRCGIDAPLLAERLEVHPQTAEDLRTSVGEHGGALLVGPHAFVHELLAARAGMRTPVALLVRSSTDQHYQALKEGWYRALGVEPCFRPSRAAGSRGIAQLRPVLRLVRSGFALGLAPDLLQRRGEGIAVRLFGRRAWLPAGAFYMGVRHETPFLTLRCTHRQRRYHLETDLAPPSDPSADRDLAMAALAQRWTDIFESDVRAQPEMWQFWLDKKWSRWLERPAASEASQ